MSTVINTTDPRRDPPPFPDDSHGGLYGAARRVVHAHAIATDTFLAVGLLGLSTLWLALSPFLGVGTLLVQSALIVPLIWRRSYPSFVFLAMAMVALVQWLLGYRLIGDASLLVALYTVAVHESRRHALVGWRCSRARGVVGLHAMGAGGNGPEIVPLPLSYGRSGLFSGLTVRSGSEYMGWLAERAERLEVERDQQKAIGAATERTRIAREIHDIVAHSLSVIITLSDAAAVTNGSDPSSATETMRQASEVGRQALGDMRTVIQVLRTDDHGLDFAPQPDLEQLGALYERVRATGLEVEVTVMGKPFVLGATTELTVYRILQEALTNTIKHASATEARVLLHFRRPVIEITVTDNGKAIGKIGTAGHGIAGMNERAGLTGGTLDAGPVAGGGWRVAATLRRDSTVSA